MSANDTTIDDIKVVETSNIDNGINKCPKCGASDISLDVNTGKLRCEFCRYEFYAEKTKGFIKDISLLHGTIIGSGVNDIDTTENNLVTIKCDACGSEVVIDTNEVAQARCHWCRNTLSINKKVPNGMVPDVVLPFIVKKSEADELVKKYVGNRRFFAHPTFKKEFVSKNIMGVYFPYLLVDVNASAKFVGEGEINIREYKIDDEIYYDADVYAVQRQFDLIVNELPIESSLDKLNVSNRKKTTNIINAIMPFDTDNCVSWDANYIKGFNAEKRDVQLKDIKNIARDEAKAIAKFKINSTLEDYDRGVRWDDDDFTLKGEQYKAAYLPVWLYSYIQNTDRGQILHYIAVNGRTKEVQGSVPINQTKLLIYTFILEVLGFIFYYPSVGEIISWRLVYLLPGILFYFIIYERYRNSNARYNYESETKAQISNIAAKDDFIKSIKRLRSSTIEGANNTIYY